MIDSLGERVVLAARRIDGETSDRDVDLTADDLEADLARAKVTRRAWVRELLFYLRNIALDDRFHAPFLASVDAGRAAGAFGARAADALRDLASRRRVAHS